ncbi:hypothetical protein HYPSUDRAFT_53539 [Hypholoma sublateritium FD-334 SS-4]|uniref:Uncharacterized protein n=1 Tax=Hypholoma sublateritium (strain FD-334 SS-4) TaxID=945553 RepID=A0A0D2PZH6_HYPSF|nr:hypothetical protein HYPSUDRAFT_53539 [Hypholoma sublateritium FD-334 SS-4]
MSLEASRRMLSKATGQDIDAFKNFLGIDALPEMEPNVASLDFFSKTNAQKWSRLYKSAQATKDLKAELKELSEKRKAAGKSPRHAHAPKNRFDVSIPKIRGFSNAGLSIASPSHIVNNSDSENLQMDIDGWQCDHPPAMKPSNSADVDSGNTCEVRLEFEDVRKVFQSHD